MAEKPKSRSRIGVALLFALASPAWAQWTPSPLAIKLPDSLVFATSATVTNTSLVWHPVNQRYYSVRIGNVNFPLHTWLSSGGASIAETTAGFDTRGLWYNPGTGQLERNGFNSNGWATVDVDGALNATNTYSMILTGLLQPGVNSMGVFEPSTNAVLFYNGGNLQVRDRTTGAVVQTLPLSGTSLAQVSPDGLLYTGQSGYEIALLDYVNKRVLFFDRATGVHSGVSQLPASAVTASNYRLGYTNDRFWLFDSATKTWNAYCLWTVQCSILLPVTLVRWSANCADGGVELNWATASEHNSSHFTIERSSEGTFWEPLAQVEGAGHSQSLVQYVWRDERPLVLPMVYYRIRQVDVDGSEEVFHVLAVQQCGQGTVTLEVWPNPTDDRVEVRMNTLTEGSVTLVVKDVQGRAVLTQHLHAAGERMALDLAHLRSGTYLVIALDGSGVWLGGARIVRR